VVCNQAERVKKYFEEQACHTVEEIDAELEKDRASAELGNPRVQFYS
jgi:hypothetical protein